jgi:signal transduction histidine kinase
MRLRVSLLVVATSSLVLVSFLVPLALVLRTLAADRATSAAAAEARSLVRPLAALAQASDRLAAGELSARAAVTGPPEVRRAGAGLNRLAVRIGELLAHERETVADLSHRLRTPLTALRIDAESLRDGAEMERLLADVGAVERTVSEIIREARRPGRGGAEVICDAARVVAERAAFWWPLAEDQDRRMTVEVSREPVPVLVAADDLATCVDNLLGNVFAHTPEGAGFAVRLSRRAGEAPGWRSRTTGLASATPTRPCAVGRAVDPPVSAWTSPAASPRPQAGR